jgi:hypothetical protein
VCTVSNSACKVNSTLVSLKGTPKHLCDFIYRRFKLAIVLGQVLTQHNQRIQSPDLALATHPDRGGRDFELGDGESDNVTVGIPDIDDL